MRIPSLAKYAFLFSLVVGLASAAPVTATGLLNCASIFSGTYAGNTLANFTDFSGILNISILIVLMEFAILSVTYAFGAAFQLESLLNFSKTELLEGIFNLIIIVAVGVSIAGAFPAMQFFLNIASLAPNSPPPIGAHSAADIFVNLCGGIDSHIVYNGFTNWLGLVANLYVANTLSSLNIILFPNSWGYAYQPLAGLALLIQLLWDDQAAYFGTMFFGMFLIVLLFVIYFLFPIFLYVGLALRAFPWTRPAGGSLIALFFAFYIIFPSLMYPFVAASVPGGGVCSSAGDPLCQSGDFAKTSLVGLIGALGNNFNMGQAYYVDVVDFIGGFFGVGLNMLGLFIALVIAYELVEKIGSLLGAPSMSAQRALSRIL